MVCEVCSVDRSDDGELVILDYPRYIASDSPCPNCGGGVPRAKSVVMSDLARLAIERRNARSVVPRAFMLDA
jgi:hypothetical protein